MMNFGLKLRNLSIQSRVLFLEGLYPLVQLLTSFIAFVHLLAYVFELFDCLFSLSPQHQTQLLSFSRELINMLFEAAEADFLSLRSIMREVLLNVEDLGVEIQLHIDFLGLKLLNLPLLLVRS